MNDTRIERRSSHPLSHHPISAQLAKNIQAQYSCSIGMKTISLKEGDELCMACYYRKRARFDKLYSSQDEAMELVDQTIKENEHSIDASKYISEDEMEEDSKEDIDDKNDDCYYPPGEEQKQNKQILYSIFELLGISPIIHMLVIFIFIYRKPVLDLLL